MNLFKSTLFIALLSTMASAVEYTGLPGSPDNAWVADTTVKFRFSIQSETVATKSLFKPTSFLRFQLECEDKTNLPLEFNITPPKEDGFYTVEAKIPRIAGKDSTKCVLVTLKKGFDLSEKEIAKKGDFYIKASK